jgi:hypothetical protein
MVDSRVQQSSRCYWKIPRRRSSIPASPKPEARQEDEGLTLGIQCLVRFSVLHLEQSLNCFK